MAERLIVAMWAADDQAAIVFEGSEMREVVASRPGAQAYRVEGRGQALTESACAGRFLG
ncbi:MAG: hypothetical protein JO244_09810 [Solirubrobacterales bacterium]|nr:hypothetical protein [Solirubrobacterales bacterium]